MNRIKKSLAIISVVALMAPATAFGQSTSADESYGGPGNIVSGLEEGGGDNPGGNGDNGERQQPVTKASNEGGNLPFTGADLAVLAAAGGTLLGLGFGLRRLTHRPTQA